LLSGKSERRSTRRSSRPVSRSSSGAACGAAPLTRNVLVRLIETKRNGRPNRLSENSGAHFCIEAQSQFCQFEPFQLTVAHGPPVSAAITEQSAVERQFRLPNVTPCHVAVGKFCGAYIGDVAETACAAMASHRALAEFCGRPRAVHLPRRGPGADPAAAAAERLAALGGRFTAGSPPGATTGAFERICAQAAR
jgi:hypothetical protein